MHESMRPQEPDPEQLRTSLIAEHGNQQMQLGGQTISFKDYVAVGDMLCPVPAEQRSPEANLRRLTKELIKIDVQLDEKYAAYIPEQPKSEPVKNKTEAIKAEKAPEVVVEKVERNVEKTVAARDAVVEAIIKPPQVIEVAPTAHKTVPIPAEVLAQTVEFEAVEQVEAMPTSKKATEINEVVIETVDLPVHQDLTEIHVLHDLDSQEEVTVINTELPQVAIEISEPVESFETELNFDEIELDDVDPSLQPNEYFETEFNLAEALEKEITIFDLLQEATELPTNLPEEDSELIGEELTLTPDFIESASMLEPEQMVQTPVAVVQEFFAQVLPTATEAVAEKINGVEPEVAAEIASRIEMIVIVADRLRELVITEATEGEEATQIEAFLKREYEQILIAVGIEPTEELLAEFVASIFSESYNLQVHSVGQYVDIPDEGTHEKKLFDEQTVFARAQQASAALTQKIGGNIGRILMTNIAA